MPAPNLAARSTARSNAGWLTVLIAAVLLATEEVLMAGVQKGYRVILCVPENFSIEKREVMRALGGEVILTPKDGGMKAAIEKAQELARDIEGAYVPQQFANPFNSESHYETTAPEIYEQMEGRIDAWLAGAGTGGTFSGVAKYLRERLPGIECYVVEPQGSILKGGEAGPHEVEGIGSAPDVGASPGEHCSDVLARNHEHRAAHGEHPDERAFVGVGREAQDVGRATLPHVIEVQPLHLGVDDRGRHRAERDHGRGDAGLAARGEERRDLGRRLAPARVHALREREVRDHAERTFVVEDADSDPRMQSELDSYRRARIRAGITVPLLRAGQLCAVMSVHHDRPRSWRFLPQSKRHSTPRGCSIRGKFCRLI